MTVSGATVETLIIGGGPAGSMAAMRLAASGREVMLLEKERGAHHKVCGEFLSREAVAYLREAGVDPVQLGAAHLTRVRVSSGAEEVDAELPFRALSLSRYMLDEVMLARAEEEGCLVRRGVSAERLEACDGGWRVETRCGGQIRAHAVLLANGKHDLHGWKRERGRQPDLVGFKLHWRLTAEATRALRDVMELFLFRGGYGGLSLVERDVANLCLVVRHARLRMLGGWTELLSAIRKDNSRLDQLLRNASPMWERPLAISPIPYGYLVVGREGPWTLGDQAAVIPSFTGDGMSIALHSGAMAAEMLLDGKNGQEFKRRLRGQFRVGMSVATLLSRVMVTDTGRKAALPALHAIPGAIRRIVLSTRIPERALEGSLGHRAERTLGTT
jgi:flavin-dependent dehydrogenase